MCSYQHHGKDKPTFDPEKWDQWAHAMEAHLRPKGCWGAIDPLEPGWAALNADEQMDKWYKAYKMIRPI